MIKTVKYLLIVWCCILHVSVIYALDDTATDIYSLDDLPSIPTQISVVAQSKQFSEAQVYCKNLSQNSSSVYKRKGMQLDKSKFGKPWRLPSYLEMLSALLLDKHLPKGKKLVENKSSHRYLWTADSYPVKSNKKSTAQPEVERLVIRPHDRNWYYSNERFTYDIRCVR